MSKSHRTVKASAKVGSVTPARALSAAKRVRDRRTVSPSTAPLKSAPSLVRK